jgi:hypothetical protein
MSSDHSPLPGLASTPLSCRAEFTRRSRTFAEQRVDINLIEDLRQEGWEPFEELKTGVKVLSPSAKPAAA